MDAIKHKLKEIEDRIDHLKISQFKGELLNNLRVNYRLDSIEADNYQTLGNSRLGGFPDLPMSYDYPVNNNGYYNLILQLNFSELKNPISELPENGILYLFQGAMNSDDFKIIYINETNNLEKKLPQKHLTNLNKENRPTNYDALKASFRLEHYFEGETIWNIYNYNPSIYTELTRTNSTYDTQIITEPFGGLDAIKNAYLAIKGYDTLLYNVVGLYPRLTETEYESQKQHLLNDCDDKMSYNKSYFFRKKEQILDLDKNRAEHLANFQKTKCIISIESLAELSWQWGDGGEINIYMIPNDITKRQFQNCYIDISSP